MTATTARAIVLRWGEIFLKGGNRPFFEGKLVENVRRAVRDLPGVKVQKMHGRMLVRCDETTLGRSVDRIARVFGISSLSPAMVLPRAPLASAPDADLASMSAEAIAAARAAMARSGGRPTFKVETRRTDKLFPLISTEVSRLVGARVVAETGLPVDVHHPALELGIEIGPEQIFVFSETVQGPGGLPVGVTGRVNLLLSGGIDSPVAGWLALKRGCTLVATYFHSFPYTGDKTKEKVIDLARLLAGWHGPMALRVVHFTEVQKQLRDSGRPDLAVVLYRRMMVRAAAELARAEKAQALLTGDNLAQVASQTLENMAVIEQASPLPLLRPLLTYDKLETMALARRIGTFETSIQPYEDCCALFVPEHPATKARLDDVLAAEQKLDVAAAAIDLAANAERIEITP